MSNSTKLHRLGLVGNKFTGKVPHLDNLHNLQLLNHHGNGLGTWKADGLRFLYCLTNVTNLYVLDLSNNNFGGLLPESIGNLSTNLGKLILSNNEILLDLSNINLTGNILADIGKLQKLQKLELSEPIVHCDLKPSNVLLDDEMTTHVGDLGLARFLLEATYEHSANQSSSVGIKGSIGYAAVEYGMGNEIAFPEQAAIIIADPRLFKQKDQSSASSHKIQECLISILKVGITCSEECLKDRMAINDVGTQLQGEVGDLNFLSSLPNATNLNFLRMGSDNFGGVFPESIGNLSTNLGILFLDNNKIGGSIPTEMANLVNLRALDMSDNHFIGNILVDIGKLQKLLILDLSDNKFYGKTPLSLKNLTSQEYLYLGVNNLHGNIPPSLGKCPLVDLALGGNNLSGTIPKQVQTLSSLLNLYLHDNHLVWSIQLEIGNLINHEQLDVSRNMLSGKIPSTLGSCVKLRFLYIQSNNFWGTLPSSLSYLRGIEDLDLSHNNFLGKIPNYLEGFVFLQKLDLSFNDFEDAVPEIGIFKNATAISIRGNNKLCGGKPKIHLHSCNTKGFKRKIFTLILKIIIPTLFGLLGLVIVLCLLYLCCFRKTIKVPSLRFLWKSYVKLSYQSLLEVVDGLSVANMIGMGSFGSIYKGILNHGENVVVVKVLNLQFRGASKSFVVECEALRRFRHRNLVMVFTACSSVDYNGNDFKALVYEFMVNGSPDNWLHANENEDEVHVESRNLNLLQRIWDEKFQLWALVLSSNEKYGTGNEVMTLEMFTGKRPTDNMFNDNLSLHNFVKMALPEQVTSIVDPTLFQGREIGKASSSTNNTRNQSFASNQKNHECLISILNIESLVYKNYQEIDQPLIMLLLSCM
ncbi:receptor kinase-like protein Xa21 [Camellia sinensis]|uniref:receptor kinase-like protein Xa21 n=1 Tax=Camellia sinensis TaxID=4442 RepID=UPI001036499F|nr:receptor kinase-like protein Xa21 [Camellia sinensis]